MIPEKTHIDGQSFYTDSESLKYKKSNHYNKTQCRILDYILNDLLLCTSSYTNERDSETNDSTSSDIKESIFDNEGFKTSNQTVKDTSLCNTKADDNTEMMEVKTLLDLGIGCNIYNEIYKAHPYLNIIGIDSSKPMLQNCEDKEHSLVLHDIKNKLPLLPGSIDYIISISCIQWLFNDYTFTGLRKLFESIINILKRKGVGVFQFYFTDNSLNAPKKDMNNQMHKLLKVLKNICINYRLISDSKGKKRKVFLVLWMNERNINEIINENYYYDLLENKNVLNGKNKKKSFEKIKEFISRKKEKSKQKGIKVPRDSKYSGRKRRRV